MGQVLLMRLSGADKFDFFRIVADRFPRSAVDGRTTGLNPAKRPKVDSRHHVLLDAQGAPVYIVLTEAKRHHVMYLMPTLDGITVFVGKRGRSFQESKYVNADWR